METLTSRQNEYIRRLKKLAADNGFRREQGEYVCDGLKLLREALNYNAQVTGVLWKNRAEELTGLEGTKQYIAGNELFDYASEMKNSPGPLFTVKIPGNVYNIPLRRVIILENVQDPGNVGTVIRTANAFGMDAVILTGDCADLYNPKTVRSTMGAIFRQSVLRLSLSETRELLDKNCLRLYGAALHRDSVLLTDAELDGTAVAIGSEGRGLSEALLDMCAGTVVIPMQPDSESLNAAVAASVIMWELSKIR